MTLLYGNYYKYVSHDDNYILVYIGIKHELPWFKILKTNGVCCRKIGESGHIPINKLENLSWISKGEAMIEVL